MDLGSLTFVFIFVGGLALCVAVLRRRKRQLANEGVLEIELNPAFLARVSPTVGAVVYFFLETASRVGPLGTIHMQHTNLGADIFGSALHHLYVLGVVSAIVGAEIHVETFGFMGNNIWHVVDAKGDAIPVGGQNSAITITFESPNQLSFTDAEVGGKNAILRSYRELTT